MLKTENQILIVGAGPTGLALAAELKRRGVDAAMVDQQLAGANTSRACVVHARTMEELEPLGVTRALLLEGVKVPIFRIRAHVHSPAGGQGMNTGIQDSISLAEALTRTLQDG
ncbi:MAG: FAD-dependent oxidoreductase, partial [Xanthobacteraceae bacterium]